MVLWSGASRPPPHRVAVPHLLQGKQGLKTLIKFWGRSNCRIKSYGPFRTGTLVWRVETSASPSSGSTSTPRKTASGNSYKILRAIQRSDQKLWPFRTGTLVRRDEPSASLSSDSTSSPRITTSGNSYKNLRAIQRSDQKLWPFRTSTLFCCVETSA